ncbi:MAG: ATP-binding protein, partial [Deltaproteobacteria bacterium]
MESLEQQFTSVLAEIEVDGRPLTETEIVHSCVVNNDFAKFTIVLPLESRLRQILPTQIEENIRNLPSISRVAVEVLEKAPIDEESGEDTASTRDPYNANPAPPPPN